MDLQIIINNVLPEGSILYKHNHGLFDFYIDEENFKKGKEFLSQKINEGFTVFIERIIKKLIEREKEDKEPLTTIDYYIYVGF